jgi:large subunit ribosomal protein L9
MQLILLQDVENVGLRGDVVDVARGYARNFLLPRRLAEEATAARLGELAKRDSHRARHEASTSDQAREIQAVLEQAELRFEMKAGPTGSLFGSVTATDIADSLWEEHKVRVDRRKIDLQSPIKSVGRYAIAIDVFEGVSADVTTLVIPEGGELPPEELAEEAAASDENADELVAAAIAEEDAEPEADPADEADPEEEPDPAAEPHPDAEPEPDAEAEAGTA